VPDKIAMLPGRTGRHHELQLSRKRPPRRALNSRGESISGRLPYCNVTPGTGAATQNIALRSSGQFRTMTPFL
jgi:hypothetical protein